MCSMWRYIVPDRSEEKNELICEYCGSPVEQEDDYCPECGTLFIEEAFCRNHPDTAAEGVCIICGLPYCRECGFRVNKLFLCSGHSDYEIYEGMAKVFGTPDKATAEFIQTVLIQAGMHPVLFSREGPYGESRYMFSSVTRKGNPLGNLLTEIKVLVACREVIHAEEILMKQNLS